MANPARDNAGIARASPGDTALSPDAMAGRQSKDQRLHDRDGAIGPVAD